MRSSCFYYLKPKHFSCRPSENFLFFSFGLLLNLDIKYLDRYDNDNKFIKERRFEVILTSFSSSNDYRPLLNYNSVYK